MLVPTTGKLQTQVMLVPTTVFIVSIFTVVVQLIQASGLSCYGCVGATDLTHCTEVVPCQPGVCSQWLYKNNSQNVYVLGCSRQSDSSCHQTTNDEALLAPTSIEGHINKRYLLGGLTRVCSQCCTSSLCNKNLCNEQSSTESVTKTDLTCYGCAGITDLSQCNNRVSCQYGVCSQWLYKNSTHSLYVLGCSQTQESECKSPSSAVVTPTITDSILLGRSLLDGMTRVCSECCTSSMCNKDLCGHQSTRK